MMGGLLNRKGAGRKRARRSRSAVKQRFCIYLILAAALLMISTLAPALAPHDPYQTKVVMARKAPTAEYLCGTDELGRCVLSRILYGARTSVFSSLLLVGLMALAGSLLGILSGYYGGVLDSLLMRVTDFVLAFPQMVVAIVVAGILGGSLVNAMIALGVTGWPSFARIARSRVLAIKGETYMEAAHMANNPDTRIIWRYVLPSVAGPLVVNATIQISTTLLDLAGMSFLGLGVQIPKAEWGSMINEGRSVLQIAPWIVGFPALAILITVIIFNLLGDSARDLLDVEMERS